jgi:hypothetical protein
MKLGHLMAPRKSTARFGEIVVKPGWLPSQLKIRSALENRIENKASLKKRQTAAIHRTVIRYCGLAWKQRQE